MPSAARIWQVMTGDRVFFVPRLEPPSRMQRRRHHHQPILRTYLPRYPNCRACDGCENQTSDFGGRPVQRESRESASGDRGTRDSGQLSVARAGRRARAGGAGDDNDRASPHGYGRYRRPLMSRHHDSNHPPGAEQVGGASSPPASACQTLTGSPWSRSVSGSGTSGGPTTRAPSKPIKQQQAPPTPFPNHPSPPSCMLHP